MGDFYAVQRSSNKSSWHWAIIYNNVTIPEIYLDHHSTVDSLHKFSASDEYISIIIK